MNKPIRVVQAVLSMQPSGGINQVAFQLATFFQKWGLSIETVTGELPEGLWARVVAGRMRKIRSVEWLTKYTRGYLQVNLTVVLFTLIASWILKRRSRDSITISHGDSFCGDIFVGHSCHWAAVHAKIRQGERRWIFYPLHWFVLLREAWVFRRRRFQFLIAISKSVLEEFQHYHRVPADKIKIIHNGVDTRRFSSNCRLESRQLILDELGLAKDVFTLLFVGHEFRRKGLEPIIRALAIIEGVLREVVLIVAGRDCPDHYKRLLSDLEVSDRVYFLGVRNDVERLMAAADLFVFPSNYEPFGLVCLEAMSSGTPVLATKIGGIAEYLEDSINGLFIKRDPIDIAEKISSLLRDPVRMRDMSIAARKTAESFDWEKVADRYLEVIQEAARQKEIGRD